MNYFKNFNNETAIIKPNSQAIKSTSSYPNISYIEDSKDVEINALYMFSVDDAVAGDIAVMNTSGNIAFVKRRDYNKAKTAPDKRGSQVWWPIGVVAIPKTFCEDNLARLISLANIVTGAAGSFGHGTLKIGDAYLPEYQLNFGNIYPSTSIQKVLEVDNNFNNGYILRDNDWGFMSSDSIREYGTAIIQGQESDLLVTSKRLNDPNNYNYFVNISEAEYSSLSSVYESSNISILANPYFTPEPFFNETNATSDFDGSINTDLLKDGTSSFAYGCYSYRGSVEELSEGSVFLAGWYLPSIGELATMFAKCLEINDSLRTIESKFAVPIGTDYSVEYLDNSGIYSEYNKYGSYLVSSTYAGNQRFWCLNTTTGCILKLGDDNLNYELNNINGRARAFCKVG